MPRYDDDRDGNGYPRGISGNAISGKSSASHGKDRFDRILDALLIAGIIALVSATIMSLVTATKLETAFTERNSFYDREISRIDANDKRHDDELRRHNERITALEQGGGASIGNSADRQKR